MFKHFLRNGHNLLIKEHQNILSATFVITLTSLLSSLLGILRNRLLISHFYTQKHILDVYWVAFRIPDALFQILIVSTLSAAFLPVFSHFLVHKKHSLAYQLASSLLNLIIFVFLCLSLLIYILTPQLAYLIAPTFSPFQISLLISLTRLLLVSQFLLALSNFFTNLIQAHRRFLPPAISPLLYNLGIITGIIFLSKRLGIFGPVYGVIFGAFLHLLFQLPFVVQLGFRYSPRLSFSPSLKKVLRLSLSRFLSLSLYQLEQTALIFFATTLSAGSLTMFTLAKQLTNLPTRLFGLPLSQAALPFLSRFIDKDKKRIFSQMLLNTFFELIYLSLPAIAIILVLRIPLVRLAYGAPSFPWQATLITGRVVALLSLATIFSSLVYLFTRAFYALQNTFIPFFTSILATFLDISLAWLLVFHFHAGLYGLAVAILLSSFAETLLLGLLLFPRLDFSLVHFFKSLTKLFTLFLLTVFFLWLPMKILDNLIFDTTRTLPLLLLTLIVTFFGLGVYFFLSYLLQVRQFYLVLKVFKKLGSWKQIVAQTSPSLNQEEI